MPGQPEQPRSGREWLWGRSALEDYREGEEAEQRETIRLLENLNGFVMVSLRYQKDDGV